MVEKPAGENCLVRLQLGVKDSWLHNLTRDVLCIWWTNKRM